MPGTTPDSLNPDALMTHMRALCAIGPRPATSEQEQAAAEYVKRSLAEVGVTDVTEESFKSQPSYGYILVPLTIAATVAMPLAWLLGTPGKVIAALIFLVGGYTLWGVGLAIAPPFQFLIARGQSQNVIARVPPAGQRRRTLYLIGHLDTNKQRMMVPSPVPASMKPVVTFSTLVALLAGASLVYDLLAGRAGVAWWQWAVTGLMALSLVGALADERSAHIEGANDNATAVSVLLGMAAALRAEPLRHTEVVLLFTGCEEVVCVGIESYLKRHRPPKDDTYWLDLEMVGTGDVCYVTRHGISYLTQYRPHPAILELAATASGKHPDLRVRGRDMLILEEVANLRRRGYRALCLAGYGQDGYLPNWHRYTDVLDNIEPDTLSRAAGFTWALAQELDRVDS